MSASLQCVVASVSETFFDGPAASITVPGVEGEMTLLANHEPLVTTLRPGTITVRAGGDAHTYPIEGGVLECSGDKVVVLL